MENYPDSRIEFVLVLALWRFCQGAFTYPLLTAMKPQYWVHTLGPALKIYKSKARPKTLCLIPCQLYPFPTLHEAQAFAREYLESKIDLYLDALERLPDEK